MYLGEASPLSRMDGGSWPVSLSTQTGEDICNGGKKGKLNCADPSDHRRTFITDRRSKSKRKQTNGRRLFMEEEQIPTIGVDSVQTREPTVGRDWCCGSTLGISFLGYYVYDNIWSICW